MESSTLKMRLEGFSVLAWRNFLDFTKHGYFSEEQEAQLASAAFTNAPSFSLDFDADGCVMIGKDDIIHCTLDLSIQYLLEMFLLGEYLQSPSFMNATVDLLRSRYAALYSENESRVPLNLPAILLDMTSKEGGLYKFTLEAVSFAMSKRTCDMAIRQGLITSAVAFDLLAINIEARESSSMVLPPWSKICCFHTHPGGEYNSPCQDPFSWNGGHDWGAWDVVHEGSSASMNIDW